MRTKLLLAGGALAVTASVTATVTGIVTTPLVGPPAAEADELTPFEDCEELLAWYVDRALPQVGPWGLLGGYGPWEIPVRAELGAGDAAGSGSREGADASTQQPATSGETGTNVQEAGVDEPDRAKTDGDLVVHVREGLLVVTDVSGQEPRERGTLRLPADLGTPELLLAGDTVLVVGTPHSLRPMPVDTVGPEPRDLLPPPGDGPGGRVMPGWRTDERSRLLEVSVADPASPSLVSDRTFGGALVSARSHDGTVRLVLRNERPTIDFVTPNRSRTQAEAERANRQRVRDSEITDWLPTVEVDGGEAGPLVRCQDVRHPDEGHGFATVTVVTMPASDPDGLTTTAVTAGGDTVYSSLDRLYLAVPAEEWRATDVHAFALDGSTTSYVASGRVEGSVRDRWSMDEHGGVLRVAVAHGDDTWTTVDNGVTTLRERDGDLEVVGSVRGLGPQEEIKSVRWFDELAVVVTFREVDPLYTVDLRDPAAPRTLGELKIPGFSEYLHPVGGDRILGVGHDADTSGVLRGGQVSLFDVSELTDPERVATLALTRPAGEPAAERRVPGPPPAVRPVAGWEPRAFTWLPGDAAGSGTALTAVSDDWDGRSWVLEVRVTGDALAEGRRWPVPSWTAEDARALPLGDDRIAVVGWSVEVVEV